MAKKIIFYLVLGCICVWANAYAQPYGEDSEPSQEELDAAFSEAQAAREAALWSDRIIDRSQVDPLTRMVESADLIVRGVVRSKAFVYDDRGIPFTRMTMSVSEVIKGDSGTSQVEIVQEGGVSEDNPENIVMVSHTHYFEEGETELLFLKRSGRTAMGSGLEIDQRFRIFEGNVFDENGRAVIIEPGRQSGPSRLRLSQDRHPAPRFEQIKIGPHVLRKNFGRGDGPADSGGEHARVDSSVSYRDAAGVDAFISELRERGL